jgi:hypothetical protein
MIIKTVYENAEISVVHDDSFKIIRVPAQGEVFAPLGNERIRLGKKKISQDE